MKIIDIVKSRFNIPLKPKQTDNNNNLIGQVWEEEDQPSNPFMEKSNLKMKTADGLIMLKKKNSSFCCISCDFLKDTSVNKL